MSRLGHVLCVSRSPPSGGDVVLKDTVGSLDISFSTGEMQQQQLVANIGTNITYMVHVIERLLFVVSLTITVLIAFVVLPY